MDDQPRLSEDEMRALLRRLDLDQLDADDYKKLKVFLAGVIADAEAAGVDEILLEIDDEEPEA